MQPIKPNHLPVWRACEEEDDVLQFRLGKSVVQVRKKARRLVAEVNNRQQTVEFFDVEDG